MYKDTNSDFSHIEPRRRSHSSKQEKGVWDFGQLEQQNCLFL